MPLPLHCSNILFTEKFDTRYDFTASFTYTMNTNGTDPIQNNGFSVFFINGNTTNLQGGGSGAGLGVVSGTDITSTSAVSGIFLTIGFDITGEFSKAGILPVFTTGTANAIPNSIGLRITTDFIYVSSCYVYPTAPYLYGPLGPTPTDKAYQTVRIGVRKNFNYIDVFALNDQTYVKLVSFQANLSSIPTTAKFGIGYSGDTLFEVQNLTFNYS